MKTVVDEVLADVPKYRIKDSGGNVLYDNCTIEMVTAVVTEGTDIDKELFDSIQTDLNSKMNTISKATTAQAQTGTNDSNYMTPLKVAQAITASNKLNVKTGTVSDNGTIPQTAGYNHYAYFVSMNSFQTTDITGSVTVNTAKSDLRYVCSVNQSTRKVSCGVYTEYAYSSHSYSWTGWVSGTANYIEIAWM